MHNDINWLAERFLEHVKYTNRFQKAQVIINICLLVIMGCLLARSIMGA